MNPAEQTVTWLITLGVMESPKKSVSDPAAFLQCALKDGVVLCRLIERLRPGTTEQVSALMPAIMISLSVQSHCVSLYQTKQPVSVMRL